MTTTVHYVAYVNVNNSSVRSAKTCTTMTAVQAMNTVSPHDTAAWTISADGASHVADEWNKSLRLAVDVAHSLIPNARA